MKPNSRAEGELLRERSNSMLMFGVVPLCVMTMTATVLSRVAPLDAFDWLGLVLLLAVAAGVWVTAQAPQHRLVVVLAGVVAIMLGVTGAREPSAFRALTALLFAMTVALYASVLHSQKATLACGALYLVVWLSAIGYHPRLTSDELVGPTVLTVAMIVSLVGAARHLERSRHSGELNLVASEARLRATIDCARDAVAVVDDRGRVVEWGAVAVATFGITAEAALGRSLHELVGMLDAQQASAPARFEFVAKNHAGRYFPCEVAVSRLERIGGAAVFFRDISEQRKLETRLLLTDRLETMGRMVAGVAHEVNNPLAFVMSNLGHLERELSQPLEALDPSELKGVVVEVLDGARRIQSIVRNLRSFSRSGEHDTLEPVEVERALDASIHMVQPQLREARATLARNYCGAGVVMAYEGRLGQVFLNLLINAIQALPGATGRREITVHTERLEREVRVSIQDSGTGIDPSMMPRLFEPFFTTKGHGQGTGLGLSISQNIIATLGGEIVVASTLEVGTTFTVVLPTTRAVHPVETSSA